MVSQFALGVDIGSTTIKYVLTDERGARLHADYRRHKSDVRQTLLTLLDELLDRAGADCRAAVRLAGSGAMQLADAVGVPFVQEVIAAAKWLSISAPEAECAVELGGEDAKLLYLGESPELRMNEACAGGTGAFIDQMAALLNTDAAGLSALAADAAVSHPIASRCGVFAKTDVVNLLNAGIAPAEIARSILDAVAEQTVSGLACGRPLKGQTAFMGGPLTFMPPLREAFMRRIGGPAGRFVTPEGSEIGVAWGAAVIALKEIEKKPEAFMTLGDLAERIRLADVREAREGLEPLFASDAERRAFEVRHAHESVPRVSPETVSGNVYLGIDLGSTTVKCAALNESGELLWSRYERNDGRPLERLAESLGELLGCLPQNAVIRSACSTGYGADLAQAAVSAQFTEVETLAHQRAAAAFAPEATYVIDIGGQDMKCIAVDRGLISGIALNEACSSGCGAFLQAFAGQLGLSMADFVEAALRSKHPCDLGSRCTVFMNSKVRQAQRDGADVEDIAAGLCRSVVKNALCKVLRIHDPSELGRCVVVQGGTFLNNAVLRAFEAETGLEVIRPDIAGLMGAYGAALIARERTAADTPPLGLSAARLDFSAVTERSIRCRGCGNHCSLRVSRFPTGKKHISGSRCDFAARSGGTRARRDGWQERKTALLFNRPILNPDEAPRGTIGILRVLNAYEHYPYWHAVLTHLGFSIALSEPGNLRGAAAASASASIPSQNLCYPAKLAHRHAADLARAGVRRIWMPCIPLEGKKLPEAHSRYACPVAGGYPEALKLNLPVDADIELMTPFVDLEHPETVEQALLDAFSDVTREEAAAAIKSGREAMTAAREALRALALETIASARKDGRPVIVLAGHPYHLDPEINHGIPNLIESMGAGLITEDAAALIAPRPEGIEALNQWTFHSRLYRSAALVAANPDFELVQLESFGCGLDAVTSDQAGRMLSQAGRIATLIKIDEGESLGSVKIRLKSLLAAVKDRNGRKAPEAAPRTPVPPRMPKTASAKDIRRGRRTIYAPQMAPIHFPLIAAAAGVVGWNIEILPDVTPRAIELGLRHVNNDACYPAIVTIGQLLEKALDDPDFRASGDALLLSQTCGPCRASNYLTLLRWALRDAGAGEVPVLALSAGDAAGDAALSLGFRGLLKLMKAVVMGDLLQRLVLYARAHEVHKGSADRLLAQWTKRASAAAAGFGGAARAFRSMVRDFMALELNREPLPRIGIAGEILLKYHPAANLGIEQAILDEGCEPVQGDISSFLLYCLHDSVWRAQHLGASRIESFAQGILIKLLERLRSQMRKALEGTPIAGVATLREMLRGAEGLISPGQQAGEGWLLASEMSEYARKGAAGVVCLQPFGCLPNHVAGKGILRALRARWPSASFCALDFDAGTSKANAANRLKLFLEQARKNFRIGSCGEPFPAHEAPEPRRVIPIFPTGGLVPRAASAEPVAGGAASAAS